MLSHRLAFFLILVFFLENRLKLQVRPGYNNLCYELHGFQLQSSIRQVFTRSKFKIGSFPISLLGFPARSTSRCGLELTHVRMFDRDHVRSHARTHARRQDMSWHECTRAIMYSMEYALHWARSTRSM
jgi:hypothetical protein